MPNMSEFIAAMPKAELHVHIEGTIEADLLLAIADRNGIHLPYKTADDILSGQREGKTDAKQNLDSFIECLDVCRGVLRTQQDYEDITYEFLKKCHGENIIYSEIMFDPQQGLRQGMKLEALLEGLFSGARAANQAFGISTQWIMNFQRDYPVEDACNILLRAQPYKDDIVGIGLDNPEIHNFPEKFAPLFQHAKEQGYRLTSHCDVHQPNSIGHIRDCIEILGVERIDHGLNAIEDETLIAQLVDGNIALTGCPNRYAYQPENASSNDLGMMIRLLEQGVLVSINSDDPAQFGSGWLTQTMIEAQKNGNLSLETMIKFMRCSFQSAWLPEDRKTFYLQQLERFSESGDSIPI